MSFRPAYSGNSQSQNWNEFNNMIRQLNKEQTVKTFKQPGGNAIINGKLPYTNGYGSLYYDNNNVARILIGVAPDGEIDIGASIGGEDITTLYV
jgi:hypothetical protein